MKKIIKLKKISIICLVFYLVFNILNSHASTVPITLTSASVNYLNLRHKAMGGTWVATSLDESALFTNPAGLAQIGFGIQSPLHPTLEITNELINKLEEIKSLGETDLSVADRIGKISNLVPLSIGFNGGIDPVLTLTNKYFGIGAYGQVQINADIKNKTMPRIEIQAFADGVPVIGLANSVKVFDYPLDIGASIKYINRVQFYDESTGAVNIKYSLVDLLSKIDSKDNLVPTSSVFTGFGADIGVLGKLKTNFGEGYWGLTYQNLGTELKGVQKLKSTTNGSTTESEREVIISVPQILTVGLGLNASLPYIEDFFWSLDYRLIPPEEDKNSFFKNLHIGVEKKLLFDVIKLRAGINQGYIVGGIKLDLYVAHLEYVKYTEEKGSEIGVNPYEYQAIKLGILF